MADAARRARGAAEGPGDGARSCRRIDKTGRADRLYHLLGIAAGKRRADPKLCRPPSGFCHRAAVADHDRAVGQGGGFCRRHAAIGGRTFDDAAPHRHGWIFRLGSEKEYVVVVGWARRSVPTITITIWKMVGTAQVRLCPPYDSDHAALRVCEATCPGRGAA